MQNPFVKWGLVAAVFTIVLKLSSYMINQELVDSFMISFVAGGVLLFCMIRAVQEERSLGGGFISFGKVFLTVILGTLIYYVVTLGFDQILKMYIAPELVEKELEKSLEMLEEVMAMMGRELGDEEIAQAESQVKPGIGSFFSKLVGALICQGLIMSLLIAVFMHKKDPEQDLL